MKKSYLNGKVIISKRGGMTALNVFGFIFFWERRDSLFRKIFQSFLFREVKSK